MRINEKKCKRMKKRNYKRIYRPGTLFRVQGSDCVFMSLGLNPRNNRQIFSFNGIDIVKRKAVTRADGRAVPARKWEEQTYWQVMKEIISEKDKRREDDKRLHDAIENEARKIAKEDCTIGRTLE